MFFILLLSSALFAQNATLNCSTLTATGDDGTGAVTLSTGNSGAFGCCMVMTPIAGTPSTTYLSASCDGPIYVLQHGLNVTNITLSGRKNSVSFSPFETLVITTPSGQIRKFPMLWNAVNATDVNYSQTWNINLTLPALTTFYVDAYFSANLASSCGGIGCLASTVWTLQGSL